MIECPDGHLFCKACVLAFSQERLGQRNATLKCMHMSGCNTEFAPAQLEECLPDTLFSLYERVKQEEEIAANLEDLEECPFCPFKRVIENEAERLFRCMNEECQVISCRSCKEPVSMAIFKSIRSHTWFRIIYPSPALVCTEQHNTSSCN
jgi:TRIAD3 protein (E3 ubiquitin-protein ligase RNF216)